MKKRTCQIITTFVLVAFSSSAFSEQAQNLSSATEATIETPNDDQTPSNTAPIATDPATEDSEDYTPQGKPVNKASDDASSQAKRKMWGNIALAAAAVVVAVVAILVVSNNNGHSSK